MVAALLKIVHTGIQDERLLPLRGQPALSFFKKAFVKADGFKSLYGSSKIADDFNVKYAVYKKPTDLSKVRGLRRQVEVAV